MSRLWRRKPTRPLNRYGDHVLPLAMANLPGLSPTNPQIPDQTMALIRKLVRTCDADAQATCEYRRQGHPRHAPANTLHCVFTRRNARLDTTELLRFVLGDHCASFDAEALEARDVNGNTPLLLALHRVAVGPQLFVAIRLLTAAGADVRATNAFGEGALHVFLRRLSHCNDVRAIDMDAEKAAAAAELLRMLLEGGCDPAAPNGVGFTPLDAAWSPVALPLFCAGLQAAGYEPTEVIGRSCGGGTSHPGPELEALYTQVLAENARSHKEEVMRPELAADKAIASYRPCCVCGRGTEWTDRRFPFDEFRSVVVDEVGDPIHMTWHRHEPGSASCMRVYLEDTCHYLDYQPCMMTTSELEMRRRRRD